MSEISGAAKELAIEYSRTNFTRYCAGKLIDAGTGRGYWEKLALHIQQSIDTATAELRQQLAEAQAQIERLRAELIEAKREAKSNLDDLADEVRHKMELKDENKRLINEVSELAKELADSGSDVHDKCIGMIAENQRLKSELAGKTMFYCACGSGGISEPAQKRIAELKKTIHRIAASCGNPNGSDEAVRVILRICKDVESDADAGGEDGECRMKITEQTLATRILGSQASLYPESEKRKLRFLSKYEEGGRDVENCELGMARICASQGLLIMGDRLEDVTCDGPDIRITARLTEHGRKSVELARFFAPEIFAEGATDTK